jgi:hypothetical protein
MNHIQLLNTNNTNADDAINTTSKFTALLEYTWKSSIKDDAIHSPKSHPSPKQSSINSDNLSQSSFKTTSSLPQGFSIFKMKVTTAAMATLITLLPLTNAWIFQTCAGQADSTENRGCSQAACGTGTTIDWSNPTWIKYCVLRLYKNSDCTGQIGIATEDWKHTLAQPMAAWDVQGC